MYSTLKLFTSNSYFLATFWTSCRKITNVLFAGTIVKAFRSKCWIRTAFTTIHPVVTRFTI